MPLSGTLHLRLVQSSLGPKKTYEFTCVNFNFGENLRPTPGHYASILPFPIHHLKDVMFTTGIL